MGLRHIFLSILLLTSHVGVAAAIELVESPDEWWQELVDEAFAGIELTEPQDAQLKAILDQAARDRQRYADIQKELKAAREEGNAALQSRLTAEIKEVRDTFRPLSRLKLMGEFLDEEQRSAFERNLRLREDRLLAERWEQNAAKQVPVEGAEAAPEDSSE